MHEDPDPIERDLAGPTKRISFGLEGVGEWEILVPQTVYPPREDTLLLARALGTIQREPGLALEIGCGSGAISIVLASLGWSVETCDVNPMAVAAARGNAQTTGLSDMISISEGGVGEPGWNLPEGTDLVVWNLPYLDPEEDGRELAPIEDASMLDIPGGWSDILLKKIMDSEISEDCLVVLLQRTDPPSQSKSESWLKAGWACRTLRSLRMGDERLEAVCYWKPVNGNEPLILDECESTMDEAKKLDTSVWSRVLSLSQTTGRGRGGSRWMTTSGGLACTWVMPISDSELLNPGILQTSIGSVLSSALGCQCKWPNDLIDESGVKLGGILVESSTSESAVRVGIGINRDSTIVNGASVSGWKEVTGEISLMEVFAIIDSALASLFEKPSGVSRISTEELVEISWRGLANSLSRGVLIDVENGNSRVVGIDKGGRLEIESSGVARITDEVGRLDWVIPSG